MAQVWAAYTHTVHYLVDTEEESIEVVELPGWMNEYGDPEVLWEFDGHRLSHSDVEESILIEDCIKILENAPLPNSLQT